VVYPQAGFLKPTVGNDVNGKSTLIGAFVNPGKSTYIGASDPRGRHSGPSGNVPRYLTPYDKIIQSYLFNMALDYTTTSIL
jgi:hypothetical protein